MLALQGSNQYLQVGAEIEAVGRGAKTLDGLGMLVYQGAIAFAIWTGKDAPINAMRQALGDVFA